MPANPMTDPPKITHAPLAAAVEGLAWELLDCPVRQPHLCTRENPCGTCRRRMVRSVEIITEHFPSDGAHAEREGDNNETVADCAGSAVLHSGISAGDRTDALAQEVGSDLVPSLEERARQHESFVIITTGDGATTALVSFVILHQAVHDAMCACGKSWDACNEAESSIRNLVLTLNDDDAWTHEYPDRQRHIWCDHGEDYTITVSRVTQGLAGFALSVTREREERITYLEAENRRLGKLITVLEERLSR